MPWFDKFLWDWSGHNIKCAFSVEKLLYNNFFWIWEPNQPKKVTNRAFWLGGFKTAAWFFKKTILLWYRIDAEKSTKILAYRPNVYKTGIAITFQGTVD